MTEDEANQNPAQKLAKALNEGKNNINNFQQPSMMMGYPQGATMMMGNQPGVPMMMGNQPGVPMMMGNQSGAPMMMGNQPGVPMMMGNQPGAPMMMMGNPQGASMNYQYNMGFQQGAQIGQQIGQGQINPQIIPMGGGSPQVNQTNQQGEQQNQPQFPFGNQSDNQPNQPGNQPNQPGNQPNQPNNQPNQPPFVYPQGYPVYSQFPVGNPQSGQQFPFAPAQGAQLNQQTVYVTSTSQQQQQVGTGSMNMQPMWPPGTPMMMPWPQFPINPPVSPVSPGPSPSPVEPPKNTGGNNWTLSFEGKKAPLKIQISSDNTLEEAINRYRLKSGDMTSTKFTSGGKPLFLNLKLSESGLQNNSVIKAETSNMPAQPQFYPIQGDRYNLIFEQKAGGQTLTIQIQPDKKVIDAINSYKNKILIDGQMKFIFNGQNLNPDLTLKEAGLKNGSKILVITTKDIEGA